MDCHKTHVFILKPLYLLYTVLALNTKHSTIKCRIIMRWWLDEVFAYIF